MSYNWDDETTLLLIQKFRENEVLWNPENPDYKSRIKRIETLKEIANLFGPNLDSTEIERKLKNLTSHYYRENKKYEEWKKSGESTKKPKWFAYKPLEFLRKKNRPTQTQSKYENNAEQIKPVTRRKRNIHTEEERADTAKKLKQKTVSSERDEAAIFGEYIVTKLRRMDPVTTSTVEHLIQNIIYQAEMGVYSHNIPGGSSNMPAYFAASTLRRFSYETNSRVSEDANSEFDEIAVKSEEE